MVVVWVCLGRKSFCRSLQHGTMPGNYDLVGRASVGTRSRVCAATGYGICQALSKTCGLPAGQHNYSDFQHPRLPGAQESSSVQSAFKECFCPAASHRNATPCFASITSKIAVWLRRMEAAHVRPGTAVFVSRVDEKPCGLAHKHPERFVPQLADSNWAGVDTFYKDVQRRCMWQGAVTVHCIDRTAFMPRLAAHELTKPAHLYLKPVRQIRYRLPDIHHDVPGPRRP